MKDEIMIEVWRNRDILAARYGHNLDAIVNAMRKRQRRSLPRATPPCTRRRLPARSARRTRVRTSEELTSSRV